MHYLYRHIRLDKNEPFYIGIGTKRNPMKSMATEYRRSFEKSDRNKFWSKVYTKCIGQISVEILYESESYDEIKEKEKEFIALYGRRDLGEGTLTNLTDGGDGTINSVFTISHRKKLSDSKKGNKNHLFGKKFSEAHKDNIRKALLGRYVTPIWRQRMRTNNAGNKQVLCLTNGLSFISAAEAGRNIFPLMNNKTARTNIARSIANDRPYKNYKFQWLVR